MKNKSFIDVLDKINDYISLKQYDKASDYISRVKLQIATEEDSSSKYIDDLVKNMK
ncbi:MAG: hypothetical protein IJ272_05745 [Clostridia bacterium]|nr:hypothetical protein [Clostridia bacterium]